jgi:site-specific recombinase XerD
MTKLPIKEESGLAFKLEKLKEKVRLLAQRGLEGADNTRKAYQTDLKQFESWCQEYGQNPCPVSPETLVTYLAFLQENYKWASIQRKISAIRKLHELRNEEYPSKDVKVKSVLEGLKREKSIRQNQAPAFTLEEFRKTVGSLENDNLQELRDKIVLILGFAGAFRRSELVSVNIEDLRFQDDHLIIGMKNSKTNQYGEIEEKVFFKSEDPDICPITTLNAWLELLPLSGPLFVRFRKGERHGEIKLTEERLSDKSVDNIVKHYFGKEYSAHSLRASFVTIAKLNGADDMEVMQQTKHKTSLMIQRYTRINNVTEFNAVKKIKM